MASAIALAQRGAVVTVLEQATELGEVGAGLQIGPNGVAVLEALGMREAAAAAANVPKAVELRDMATGREIARLPMGQALNARVTVSFTSVGTKVLLVQYAKLKRVQG